MKQNLPKIFLITLLILMVGNLVWVDWRLISEKRSVSITPTPSTSLRTSPTPLPNFEELVDQKVSQAIAKLPTAVPPKTVTVSQKSDSGQARMTVSYVPIISEATTNNTSWTDILSSRFFFNLADYQGAKEVRLIVNLQAEHGSAPVFVRLYDQSNNRGVDYSDLSTQSGEYAWLESSPLSIWNGNNLYNIQLKSANGTLVLVKEAKLKISF